MFDRNWRARFRYIDRQYFETFAFSPWITKIWGLVTSGELENHFFITTGTPNDPNTHFFRPLLANKLQFEVSCALIGCSCEKI